MSDTFDSDIDPTIAAMLADVNDSSPDDDLAFDDFPLSDEDFGFSTENIKKAETVSADVNAEPWRVDTRRERIKEVKKLMEDEPQPFFSDKNYENGSYYKTALEGEGEQGQRVNQLLKRYLTTQDPKEKSQYRLSMSIAWWDLVGVISKHVCDADFPIPKRMLMRFGVALPSLFTPEQKDLFSKAFFKNTTGEPVYYVDEWLEEISKNHIALSATDEKNVRAQRGESGEKQRLMQLKAKNDGKLQTAEGFASSKQNERNMVENEVQRLVEALCEHAKLVGHDNRLTASYTDQQRESFSEIYERLRSLQKIDKDYAAYLRDLEEAREIGISLEQKIGKAGLSSSSGNNTLISSEFDTIRQMVKMACGRRGNPFPVFTREFYHCPPHGTGFREEVVNILRWIEMNDRSIFRKKSKGITNRVLPFVLLIPTYGDFGFCWQPFDRLNRATSRGRLIIPMYPKNLKTSILMAAADYRWQYAKEKALDWTDPNDGLCGQYFQYLESKKIKADPKKLFIADYVTWFTKEYSGTQVLEKELRGIFWRNIPFCKERREELSKRSMAYLDLYKKDGVRLGSFSKEELREWDKNNSPYDSLPFPGEKSEA